MTDTKKYRVGLVGAGLQGRRRSGALQQADNAELVIVDDINHEAAQLLAAEYNCEAAYDWHEIVARDDIDIIIICTPPNLHEPVSVAAMKNGKHVLCEKALARNPEEARKMVDTATENKVVLKCGFNHRHHPAILQAYEWFKEGAIGEPSFIRCRYGIGGRPGYDKEWRADPEVAGGGQLMDQGMHVIDLSRWFLGEFSEVSSFLSTTFWDVNPMEDNAFVMMRTEDNKVVQIHASWTQWKNLFIFEIYGKDGYITVEGLGGSYGVEKAILGKREFLKPFREDITEFRGGDQSWYQEWVEFTSSIAEDRQPLGSGYDGLKALELVYAAYESNQTGSVARQ